jgi:hypothetical protein
VVSVNSDAMPYLLLADAVLLLHLAFIAFVVVGALIGGAICPLTPLENALRAAGGGSVYTPSFIEHYLLPIVYPDAVQGAAGRGLQVALGVALVAGNAGLYALLLLRRRRAVAQNRAGRRQAGP